MLTSDNMEQQYDQLISHLDGYRLFVTEINSRVASLPLRDPIRYFRLMREFKAGWRQLNPLSGKNTDFNRQWAIENATAAERGSDYYPIVVSDYPFHELSISIEIKFSNLDFEKIKELHDLKKHQISRLSVKQMTGVVLAGGTILLKSIPESVVVRVVDYQTFELIVFLVASLGAAYLFLILLPLWVKYSRARRVHEYVGDIIEYTSIRTSK